MNITFLGGAKEVGRSAFLLEEGNARVLLDYGVNIEEEEIPKAFPIPFKGYVDAVILSHAHLDHSGGIPLLYRDSEPKTFMTPPSIPLVELLIRDSLKIADLSDKYLPFGENELRRMMRRIGQLKYEKEKQVTEGVMVKPHDAGHVIGSVMPELDFKGRKILYTGDFNLHQTRLHDPAFSDFKPGEVDVLIIESTYADRVHPDRRELEKEFVQSCLDVLDSGGNVLVPAFALGRAQEILMILNSYNVPYPVYLDGMAKAIADIMISYPEYVRDPDALQKALMDAEWVSHPSTRRKVFKEPSIVVSPAGMMQGGHVVSYMVNMLKKSVNPAVFLTGYQVPGTPGRVLLEEKRFSVENININCSDLNVKYFDFSAHADQPDLHEMIKTVDPKLVIIVHGDPDKAPVLKQWVEDNTNAYAILPDVGDVVNIDKYL